MAWDCSRPAVATPPLPPPWGTGLSRGVLPTPHPHALHSARCSLLSGEASAPRLSFPASELLGLLRALREAPCLAHSHPGTPWTLPQFPPPQFPDETLRSGELLNMIVAVIDSAQVGVELSPERLAADGAQAGGDGAVPPGCPVSPTCLGHSRPMGKAGLAVALHRPSAGSGREQSSRGLCACSGPRSLRGCSPAGPPAGLTRDPLPPSPPLRCPVHEGGSLAARSFPGSSPSHTCGPGLGLPQSPHPPPRPQHGLDGSEVGSEVLMSTAQLRGRPFCHQGVRGAFA